MSIVISIILAALFVTTVLLPAIYMLLGSARAKETLRTFLSRRFYMVVMLSLLAVGGVFAATQIVWTNSSTITAGQDIYITQPTFTAFTTCPVDGDPQYFGTGFAPMSWSLTQGGPAQLAYFCMNNRGSSADTPSVTSTLTLGSCPSTSSNLVFETPVGVPTTLQPHTTTTTPITIGVCAGSNLAAGAGPTFTITVK